MLANQSATDIRRGSSQNPDPVQAALELAEQIGGHPAALRVVYASPSYDLDLLGPALCGELVDAPLMGCTTAGEIGPEGYLTQPGLTGFALPKETFQVDLAHIDNLRARDIAGMGQAAQDALAEHQAKDQPGRSFGILLVDGLSVREEPLVSALHGALGGLPLCGGSAGDDLQFQTTKLMVEGRFVEDCATLALVRTTRPFLPFKLQHFLPTEKKLVVTAADPGNRVVHEINGLPAAEGYADAIGMQVDRLSPQMFSTYPVVVRVGGQEYVRSIQKVEPDGSLTFFCAIDDGLVLTVASGENMVHNLEQEANRLLDSLGKVDLTIGFDCILRRLESKQENYVDGVDEHLTRLKAIGFATYGEQFGAMHVNQTLTGVVIGASQL